MAEFCSNRIFFKTTPSEKREIVSAFEQGKIDWPVPYVGLHFYENEMCCSTKYSPKPWDEGYMARFSAMYPTILFQYKTDVRMYGSYRNTWFGNGKEDDKSSLNEEIKRLSEKAVQRFCQATTQVAEGLRHRVEIMPDGCVAEDGENIFGECEVCDWTDIVQVSCGNWHTVGLRTDGTLLACGSNANGQCNVDGIADAVFVSCGRYHTAILRKDGTVTVLGTPEEKEQNTSQSAVQDWSGIKRILSVYDAVVGIQEDGTLLVTGNPGCTERALKVYLGLAKAPKKKEMSAKTGGLVLTVAEAKKLWKYRVRDNAITLCEYYGTESHVIIPEMIGKTPVTELDSTFNENEEVCSIVVPKTVTEISWAFQECPELESIVFEGALPEYQAQEFHSCPKLADKDGFIIFKNVVFGYEGNASNLILPDGITKIATEAFAVKDSIQSITIPGTVALVEECAFSDCKKLENVVLQEGVKEIGDYAFDSFQSKLIHITIPASVTAIGENICNNKNTNLVVHVTEGSYAEQYCEENNLTYDYV